MTTVVAAGRRVLPRGYLDFGRQVAIWLGFYFGYLAVRGLVDRNPTKAILNGINVIDFERLQVQPPRFAKDLPAGGRRLLQGADGYLHTFVSGVETMADGVPTGEHPGRLVRHQRPDPS